MTLLADLTVRTRGPNKPRTCPTQCTLCGNGTGNGADGLPCVGCNGTGVPHRAGEIRAKPTRKSKTVLRYTEAGPPPDLPIRPTDGSGRLVSDAVFLALFELGWCRLAPFDDPAHTQGRML